MTVRERAATYFGLGRGRSADEAPARSRSMAVLGAAVTGYVCVSTLLMAAGADGAWPVGWRLAVAGVFGLASTVIGFGAVRRPGASAGSHPD